MAKLNKKFYLRNDVVQVAKDLIGKVLCTNIEGEFTSGLIVETEAYGGRSDNACHGQFHHYTDRAASMFLEGGLSYVYICYGIHRLFNVITNEAGKSDAILIRAIEPIEGYDIMEKRRALKNQKKPDYRLTRGPGCLTIAMGISMNHDAMPLNGKMVWIEESKNIIAEDSILTSKRVGVAPAGRDADLPYRFYIKDNRWVSPWKA